MEHQQRLYFPYHLSRDHWGSAGLERGACLESLLQSPLMAAFTTALSDTTYPFLRLESWLTPLMQLLSSDDRVRGPEQISNY